MTGLLNLLLRKVPAISAGNTEGDQYLEQAAAVPASGTAQLDALRAIALYYELYQEQDDWRAAALALARFASDVSTIARRACKPTTNRYLAQDRRTAQRVDA